ncbi:ABC transporter ATP-binding protein [soil metagenome]
MSPGAALHVAGLHKRFDNGQADVHALRGLDLVVGAGEFVAIMGPSGCGKSTLLNLVAGLEQPDAGTIVVADESIVGRNEKELALFRRRHIGLVFQFYNLIDELSVLDNVAVAAMVGGRNRKAAETRARDLLDLLGLGGRGQIGPDVLSGGQRQRLAIARALANNPTLLLADEPTGALDSEGGSEMAELFLRLNAEGQTIVMVTHDPALASVAARVERMLDGQVVTNVLADAT